jgi:flagellar biosynthesis/type III secretory pathway M-ring protein FliF/YscJ
MSLSILVGQEMRWQGEGKAKHRVAVPPDPETLKAIRELVSGVTGYDEERGDQLVVDSLPFEGDLLVDPSPVAVPATAPGPKLPPWQQLLNSYWHLILLAVLGVAVLAIMLRGVSKTRSRAAAAGDIELDKEIAPPAPVPEFAPPQSPARPELASSPDKTVEDILGKTRLSAQRDPNVTANVLRMWLQDPR